MMRKNQKRFPGVCGHCRREFIGYRSAKFCGRRCSASSRVGEKNSNWRGERPVMGAYIKRRAIGHPSADSVGYVHEHVLVAERALGKYLPPFAVVHHRNEDPHDNRPENLVICQNQAYHVLIHERMRPRHRDAFGRWMKRDADKETQR